MRPMRRSKQRPDLNFAERLELRFAHAKSIDGLWVGGFEDKPTLERVERALALIRTHDPLSYRRVLRELERVWVTVLTGPQGLYRASIRACALDTRFVQGASAELIASTIVHEATHARLARCGIVYDEALRVRIESVCVRRQRAFAAKLPQGEPARQQARDQLAGLAPETYTDQAFAERTHRGEVEALEYLGVPDWLIRTLFRARDWRLAIKRRLRRNGR